MAEVEPIRATVIAAMVIVLAGVGYLEIRIMRNRRRKREARGEMPDRAHNAILSAKGIADALGRTGVRSVESDDLIREAETALENRNYRVASELADRAKGVLRKEKARQQAKGDLSKLETVKPPAREAEPTTKEKLTKELPPNFVQAKFSMNVARDEIGAARSRGQDVGEAEQLLAQAQATFDAQDYTVALAQASRVRRVLEGVAIPSPPIAPTAPAPASSVNAAKSRSCPSCGAPVTIDDAFCRKCGTKVPAVRACPSCGTEMASDDTFCRKCGTKVP
ncbi:MAG: zinc ribbon domain-containing protein [Vicinamibacteria bacterium]